MRKKYYVGIRIKKEEVFYASSPPTVVTHPKYTDIIGPFHTRKGAKKTLEQRAQPNFRSFTTLIARV